MKNKKERLQALEGLQKDNPDLEPESKVWDNPELELISRKLYDSNKKGELKDKAKKAQPLSDLNMEDFLKIIKKLKKK